MASWNDDGNAPSSSNDDDRLGEAIETYLALIEQGTAPEPEAFADRYPELREDIRAALDGLELVHGLVGQASGSAAGGAGGGPGRNLESGRRIAGYRVVSELGRGGMGTVYEAVHVGLDRPVALKVLGTHAAPDSSARRRFLNEARTAAALHHTHIVPVFDVGQAGGLCYYAMQRIEGSGLDRVVRYLRRTRPPRIAEYAARGTGPDPAGGSPPDSSSQVSSRFSKLWVRVSENLPWRHPRHIRAAAVRTKRAGAGTNLDRSRHAEANTRSGAEPTSASAAEASQAHPRQVQPALRSVLTSNDSTGDWMSTNQSNGLVQRPEPVQAAPREAAAPGASLARPRDDETVSPPFDPPRGSAYFRWVAEVGLQAAEALAHAHHHGVIHRDVKPSNLLIDLEGTIWVTDFGLARRLADPGLTHHDSLLGTPRYMSPEQARTGAIDGRTDVYSLGATLYELLTLRPPFDGKSAAELLDQIGGYDPPAPRSIDRRIPRDLETIVLKTLAKRPADRYASATALADDLARFLNREPVRARRISPIGRFWRVARRHPGITAVTSVASATVLAIATYAYVRILDERNDAIRAGDERSVALVEKAAEADKARAAARWALWANASNLLMSELPNRRAKGLDLLQKVVDPEKAIELGQDPALTPDQLRDQAVEFLVLRDVESRPEFATGATWGLEFGPGGTVLAALADPGDQVTLWNVEHRQRFETISLADAPKQAPSATPGQETLRPSAGGQAEGASQPGTSRPGAGQNQGGRGNAPPGRPFRFLRDRIALAGHILAVVRPDNDGIRLFDIRTGSRLHDLNRPGMKVISVLANPASERLLTVESAFDPSRGRRSPPASPRTAPAPPASEGELAFVLWDLNRLDEPLATLERIKLEPQRRRFPAAAFGPDGKTVAIASSSNSTTYIVALHSALDGQDLGQIDTQSEMLTALALGANNVMATAAGNTIQLWDREAKTFLTSLPSARGMPGIMRFNPQGTLLATAAGNHVELWDVVSHKSLAVLPATDVVTDLGFTPDGLTLAVGVDGRTAATAVWHVSDSTARVQLGGFEARPTSLAFGPKGCLAIGGNNGDIWFYRSGGNRCMTSAATPSPNVAELTSRPADRERDRSRTSVTFDALGRLIAYDSRGLRIWKEGSGPVQAPSIVPMPPAAPGWWESPTLLARTADGQRMVLVRSSEVSLWQADQPDRVRPIIPPPPLSGEEFPPSGPAPPTAQPSQRNEPGDRPGGPRRNGPSRQNLLAIQVSPGADRLYMLRDFFRFQIWDLESSDAGGSIKAHRQELDQQLHDEFTGLALQADGSLLALGDRTGHVTLLDTNRLRVVGRITLPGEEVQGMRFGFAMAFSPDGKTLAVGAPHGQILLWSVEQPSSPRLFLRLPGQRGLGSIVFDTAHHRLASSSFGPDPIVEIWDLDLIHRQLAHLGFAD